MFKMSVSVCVVLLCLLLAAAHCSPLPRAHPKGFGTAKYALVIGCDGLGGFYVNNATSFLPNIAKFYSKGSTTAVARDQMPSVSAPNWGTIITGMGPEESGIPDNSWVPADDNPTDPTVLELPPISGRGKVCHDPCCIVPMGLCNATVCLLTPCNMYLTT